MKLFGALVELRFPKGNLSSFFRIRLPRYVLFSPGEHCAQSLHRVEVKCVSLDINPGYFRAILKSCPHAEIAVERCHLVQKSH